LQEINLIPGKIIKIEDSTPKRRLREGSYLSPLFHLALGSFRAISLRFFAANFSTRAFLPFSPPRRPMATAAGFFPLLDGGVFGGFFFCGRFDDKLRPLV
jgi:hypothetical protein